MFTANKNSNVSDEQAMRDVMALMDEWKAPEPSPWFEARMMARFREEQTKAPEGFFARLRDRFLFNSMATMKPLMIGSLAMAMLAAGGGSYLQMTHMSTKAPAISATVEDLQLLDSNAQEIQQMGQLLDDDGDNPES